MWGTMSLVMRPSWTLSEVMTKKGRCPEASGNGPLILEPVLAKEFKTFAQLIELLESRGVAIDATTLDCLRRESCFPKGICRVMLWRGGFLFRFSKVRGKIETRRSRPSFCQQNCRSRMSKTGVWSTGLGFSPHFRKRPPEVYGKFWNSRAHRPFHEQKPQVEALWHSDVLGTSGFCRILLV